MLKDRVLDLLQESQGQQVTGGALARRLGVSRTAVWKAIHALMEQGNEIESFPNSGYQLATGSETLSERRIREHLTTSSLGSHIEIFRSLSSTNQHLKALDTAALPEGYTVLSDEQTQGRGRHGRRFASPSREGIYLSVLLKPPIPLCETPFLTLCAAVAVCRALETVCGLTAGIKWVNDILYGEKKLCGILTEAFVTAEIGSVDCAILGIGVNTGRVAVEVADIATSVYAITGMRGVRNRLIAEILNQLEQVYRDFAIHGKKRAILDAYTAKLIMLGRRILVAAGEERYTATALGVDNMGALIIRRENGAMSSIATGEITLL